MTVKELINQLKKIPENNNVVVNFLEREEYVTDQVWEVYESDNEAVINHCDKKYL